MTEIPFTLGVISDEISQDLEIVIETAKDYDLDSVEIRSVWDVRVQNLTDEHLKKLKKELDEKQRQTERNLQDVEKREQEVLTLVTRKERDQALKEKSSASLTTD